MKRLLMLGLVGLMTACIAPQPEPMRMSEPTPVANGQLMVETVRANMTLPSETGSVWLVIANGTEQDETLLGAQIEGCDAVELHNMSMKDGVMTMAAVEGGQLVIPTGERVELKQGGLHIMCIGKAAPLEEGASLDIVLEFANAGAMTVTGEVVAPGDTGMDHGDMEMGAESEAEGQEGQD